MKAKCPHCATGPDTHAKSCEKCNGTGFIEVSFAEGEEYAVVCANTDCSFYNGGFIVGPSSPYKTLEDRGKPGPCIQCGAKTYYRRMDDYTIRKDL